MFNPFKTLKLIKPDTSIKTISHKIDSYHSQINAERLHLLASECPKCQQKNQLQLISYRVANWGWEAKRQCRTCGTEGIENQFGFTFELRQGDIKQQ